MVFVPVPTPPPCRREAFCIRVPLPCGRTQGRLCAYSYSISIIVCCPWFVSNSPTHPSYLVESVVEYPPPYGSGARRAARKVFVYSYSINRKQLHCQEQIVMVGHNDWDNTPPLDYRLLGIGKTSIYSYSIIIACAFTLLVVSGRMFAHPSR